MDRNLAKVWEVGHVRRRSSEKSVSFGDFRADGDAKRKLVRYCTYHYQASRSSLYSPTLLVGELKNASRRPPTMVAEEAGPMANKAEGEVH